MTNIDNAKQEIQMDPGLRPCDMAEMVPLAVAWAWQDECGLRRRGSSGRNAKPNTVPKGIDTLAKIPVGKRVYEIRRAGGELAGADKKPTRILIHHPRRTIWVDPGVCEADLPPLLAKAVSEAWTDVWGANQPEQLPVQERQAFAADFDAAVRKVMGA